MLSKPVVKYIQSLQHKKFRDEYGVFTAEGPKVVKELLASGIFNCRAVYALREWVDQLDAQTLRLLDGRLEIVQAFELEKIATYTTPNHVMAVFEKKKEDHNIRTSGKYTLVLDDIQDPGNLGTIIRTADWFGIEHIVCSLNTVDMYNSKVVQSTMASLARVNIVYENIVLWLTARKEIEKIAATLDGTPLGVYKPSGEGILIIGNEANGIKPAVLELAGQHITIPRSGMAESLNAAVATGIILYALKQ